MELYNINYYNNVSDLLFFENNTEDKNIKNKSSILQQTKHNNILKQFDPVILKILLQDKTTGKNIKWACDEYTKYSEKYTAEKEILPELIIKNNTKIIQPRVFKTKNEQVSRTRKSAEVFTPSWICNEMNNHVDDEWLGKKNVFNTPNRHNWIPNINSIIFKDSDNKQQNWMKYIDSKRLEITCGEAPYLVSRYDTTTGDFLPIQKRIGLLDRKLRVVNENTDNEEDWFKWTRRAFEAIYGYEYQGDSLLLARENLLWTFIDNFYYKFKKQPLLTHIKQIANVIAWNIWQMDGLTDTTPFSNSINIVEQFELFDDLPNIITPMFCKIKDWRSNRVIYFKDLKGVIKMKFDVIIGNPPYQETRENTSDKPVYNEFMNAAYTIAENVEFITPARFLFNAGKTPKEWNNKILNDKHFKIIKYESNSKNMFPNVDIKGGVVIHYRNSKITYKAIQIFTQYIELNNILQKVVNKNFISFNKLIYSPESYKILNNLYIDYPNAKPLTSKGHENDLVSNIFEKFESLNIFIDKLLQDNENYIKIIGLYYKNRQFKFIKKKYIKEHPNLMKYKVILPGSNGSGALGEVLSTPLIGEPLIGHTQTFISIGAFNTYIEAFNTMKYIKTKFCRIMLGILKVTQSNKKETWKYVPLQDFTDNSDIDWSKSIHEIDLQLYKKYGLDENEINFIETHVKEME